RVAQSPSRATSSTRQRCWLACRCTSGYGLAGWSWLDLDLPTPVNTRMVNGPMLGGGLEAHVRGPWYVRTEYTRHHFAGQDVGACKIERDLHVARIGAVVKFNDLPILLRLTR